MLFDASFYHALTIALIVAVTSISVGIGEGLTGAAAIQALITQPKARAEISRTFLLGMTLIETAGVLGLVMAVTLLAGTDPQTLSPYSIYANLGILCAVGISGLVLGFVASYPASAACHAVARQPFFSPKIQIVMLLTQSIMQTPLIFAFMISILIRMQAALITDYSQALRLLGAGLSIGIGSIGPTIGLALIARQTCKSMGINKYVYSTLFPFTIMSQAIVESPLIFALITSLFLLFSKTTGILSITSGIAYLSAGLCMGLGTLMPAIGSGRTAAQACESIALRPEASTHLFRASLFAQVLLETGSIYALLIAFFIIIIQ